MILRPYQRSAVDAVTRFVVQTRGARGGGCVVIPTGGGKTPVIAEICRHYCTEWPDTKIVVTAHVKELVEQNYQKLRDVWPEGDIGIFSAGLRQKKVGQVTFAQIQSAARNPRAFGFVDFVLPDECHRLPHDQDTMYRSFINDLNMQWRMNPGHENSNLPIVAGFTATPGRMDSGPVCGPDSVLSEIIHETSVSELIEAGYLCRPTTKVGHARADMSGVKIERGDYVKGSLEDAVSADDVVRAACAEMVELARDRKHWIIFCAGKKHAEKVQRVLREEHRLDFPVIVDGTPARERRESVRQFKTGEVRGLINVNVFSEGFDAPHVDCIIMLRPTKSKGLYYQQVGRGFRIHPSKHDFLVLDFAGNCIEHGPVDTLEWPRTKRSSKKKEEYEPLMKECPKCQEAVALSEMACPACGYQFPEPEEKAKHGISPSGGAILSGDAAHWHEVSDWEITRHVKPGMPDSVCITYSCGESGIMRVREWVMPEHGSSQRGRAIDWWRDHGGRLPLPADVTGILERKDEVTAPRRVKVLLKGKNLEVIGRDFGT